MVSQPHGAGDGILGSLAGQGQEWSWGSARSERRLPAAARGWEEAPERPRPCSLSLWQMCECRLGQPSPWAALGLRGPGSGAWLVPGALQALQGSCGRQGLQAGVGTQAQGSVLVASEHGQRLFQPVLGGSWVSGWRG